MTLIIVDEIVGMVLIARHDRHAGSSLSGLEDLNTNILVGDTDGCGHVWHY